MFARKLITTNNGYKAVDTNGAPFTFDPATVTWSLRRSLGDSRAFLIVTTSDVVRGTPVESHIGAVIISEQTPEDQRTLRRVRAVFPRRPGPESTYTRTTAELAKALRLVGAA